MIYFNDDLSFVMDLRENSATNTVEIRNNIKLSKDSESFFQGIIIASEIDPDFLSGRTRLIADGETSLSDIARAAMVRIFHDGFKLESSLDFIRNYRSILREERDDWMLRKIIVWPDSVTLKYYDESDEWEEIWFAKCPFDLVFEVPRARDDDGESELETILGKLTRKWRDRDDAAHGIASQEKPKREGFERVIVRYKPEEKCTEIWAGEVDKGIDSGFRVGQKMLSVAYDEDDDIVITRHYHAYNLDDGLLAELIEPHGEQHIFCL